MIKFRRKEFAIPVIASVAANGLMVGGTGYSIWQGNKQQEEMERANAEQAKLIEQQNKTLKSIAEAQKRVGGNVDGAALQQTMQKQFAASSGFLRQGGLFLGDMGRLIVKHKDHLAGSAAVGAAMGAAAYGANKYIQRDMKKEGLTEAMTGQKTYSSRSYTIDPITGIKTVKADLSGSFGKRAAVPGAAVGALGAYGLDLYQKKKATTKQYSTGSLVANTLKNNWKSMAVFGGGLGAVPTILGYQAEKKQIKDQMKATQNPKQKAYAAIGKSILSTASSFFMGGGKKGVKNVGTDLVKNGKSEWSKKLGNFMLDGKGGASKRGLALSIPVGMGVMAATWDMPQKAVENTTRLVDKKAWAYQDIKNKQI